MRWKYLRVGDVIFLQKGTTVAYPDQPVTIANHSISAFSKMRGDIWVRIGIEQSNRTDVSQEKTILRERISAAFSDLEISLDESIMDRFIAHQVKDTAAQRIFLPAANYLVVERRSRVGSAISGARNCMPLIHLKSIFGRAKESA